MVLDFILSLSLYLSLSLSLIFLSFFYLFAYFTFPPSFTLISAFMYLSMSLFYVYISIYLYAPTFTFSFFHERTFKICFSSYNLSICAPPPLFFSICYIYQLTRITSPCLALLVYRFVKTLHRIAVASFFLLRSHFLRLRRHFHPNGKKISLAI